MSLATLVLLTLAVVGEPQVTVPTRLPGAGPGPAASPILPRAIPEGTPPITPAPRPTPSPSSATPTARSQGAPIFPSPAAQAPPTQAPWWAPLEASVHWWRERDCHFWLRFLAGALPFILGVLHFEFLARRTLVLQGEAFVDYAEYPEWHRESASDLSPTEARSAASRRISLRVADAGAYVWFGGLLHTSLFWVLLLGARLGCVGPNVDLATFGALIYTLSQMIYRIASGALFGRFFFISALRCAVAVVLVTALTSSNGFRTVFSAASETFAAFLIGLFPLSALETLNRKAQSIFHPSEPGEEPVSVGFIEGIDGAVQDRLAEIGITDIQHLATADPFDLALLTFSPVDRTLDWVDQAILIQSVKRKITAFRAAGIRSAVELKVIYHRQENDPSGGTARVLFSQLAKRCELSDEAMLQLARNISEDRIVTSLWAAWQTRGRP
ncbi:MAG: hypothetical protein K1Y01_10500 [Vicinamibacteria bacterium]|nr:hypothetical protein [Vicinamibacteria bacterium]